MPTQTIWKWLAVGDYPPPKTAGDIDPQSGCWLCGDAVGEAPWRHHDAITPTFTDYAEAACLASNVVCQACVALSRSEGWAKYVSAYPSRGFSEYFPLKEGKKPRALNWLYMSHVITPSHHETPSRARWREILLCPPAPPFVCVMAFSGKKQLLFKAKLNHNTQRFYIQTDDRGVWVEPAVFADCLHDFEALYQLGLSKSAIASGGYPQSALSKIGVSVWRPLEAAFAPWRRSHPDYVMLAEFCAQKPDAPTREREEEAFHDLLF